MKSDILVVGELNVDIILNQIDGFPALGTEILADTMNVVLGSSSAIFASNSSTMGSKVAFAGKIGKDDFATKVMESLSQKAVDTSFVIIDDKVGTGATIVLNYGDNRCMVTYPGGMGCFSSSDVPDDALAKANHLHVSSPFLQPELRPGLLDLFKRAKGNGMTTSMDPQWDPAEKWDLEWEAIFEYLDVFLPNEKEILAITKAKDIEHAVAHFDALPQYLIIKQGNKGAAMLKEGQWHRHEGFENLQVIDAIGAGDSFDAGFIHAFVQGKSDMQCLRSGNLAGAINTTSEGGTGAFEDLASVKNSALSNFKETWN
ncbi:MAG: carbohydrate kinase family protein [Reichenbachiella sp.]|uniref:carbohydrate kinase family protein n=1 Tax=Reichenbachiella sp. TaxID=2184521 RepID=UPI0032991214